MDITTDWRWKREIYSRIYSCGFQRDCKPKGVKKAKKKKRGWIVVDASPNHVDMMVVFSMTTYESFVDLYGHIILMLCMGLSNRMALGG